MHTADGWIPGLCSGWDGVSICFLSIGSGSLEKQSLLGKAATVHNFPNQPDLTRKKKKNGCALLNLTD